MFHRLVTWLRHGAATVPYTLILVLACMPALGQNRSPEIARAMTKDLSLQGRVMWIDGTANIARITNIEGVKDIVAHCRKANFTTLVVDVKPVVGQVLYNSKLAERLREWQGRTWPDLDVLAAFVEEGHKAGLEVCASLNIFSEGHKYVGRGLAYKKREWLSTAYTVDRSLWAGGSSLPIRAANEPEEPGKSVVYGDEMVLAPERRSGQRLAVQFDDESNVSGVVDPAILGDEPLPAPEDGHVLVLDGKNLDWATQNIHAGERARFVATGRRQPVTEAATEKIAAFVSPLDPDARAYELSLLTEVARSYKVDGIVFDRMRYANLFNDYGDRMRAAFEKWLGKPVSHWPEDLIQFDPNPGEPLRRGPLFKFWLEFRAKVIHDFLREATETLREVRPDLQFGVYVGSWFTEYYGVGVNWGSEKFPVRLNWASPGYNEAGYAEFLDWVSTGCYYPIATREDARAAHKYEGGTVEAAAELSVAAVQNASPVYAGLYALDYVGRPEAFSKAVETAARRSQGVMVFDLSYIYDYGWWNLLEKAFSEPAVAPHRISNLTRQLREAEDASRTGPGSGGDAALPAVPFKPGGG